MKKIDLSQTITVIANLGVIGGVVFLAFEIRQNTAQMRAEAAYSVHQDVQRLNEAIYQDGDLADLIIRAEQSFESLDVIDRRRAEAYFFSQLNLADFIMGLQEEGISGVTFGVVDIYLDQFGSMPGRREFVESVVRPRNEPEHNFRSDEFYRQLLSE